MAELTVPLECEKKMYIYKRNIRLFVEKNARKVNSMTKRCNMVSIVRISGNITGKFCDGQFVLRHRSLTILADKFEALLCITWELRIVPYISYKTVDDILLILRLEEKRNK